VLSCRRADLNDLRVADRALGGITTLTRRSGAMCQRQRSESTHTSGGAARSGAKYGRLATGHTHEVSVAARHLAGFVLLVSATLGLSACGQPNSSARPETGVIKGNFSEGGGPYPGIQFRGGVITLIPLSGSGTRVELRVGDSGAFSARLAPGSWLLVGKAKGLGTSSRTPRCNKATVVVASRTTVTESFGCQAG
jgi:hypothetical protein